MRVELAGPADLPIDAPLALRVRGAGPDAVLTWRARVRDDDDRVWRACAPSAAQLDGAWEPAKTPPAPHAALQSLRPVRVEVRAEADDGRAATRTVTRRLLADGVRVRRWRGDIAASLFLPAEALPTAVLLDATAVADPSAATLAAAVLASRGVLTLVVPAPRTADAGLVGAAVARLAAVPGAAAPQTVDARAVPLPPGVPAVAPVDPEPWDALLAGLGARPRQAVAAEGSA